LHKKRLVAYKYTTSPLSFERFYFLFRIKKACCNYATGPYFKYKKRAATFMQQPLKSISLAETGHYSPVLPSISFFLFSWRFGAE
jgi:hypothetical protein